MEFPHNDPYWIELHTLLSHLGPTRHDLIVGPAELAGVFPGIVLSLTDFTRHRPLCRIVALHKDHVGSLDLNALELVMGLPYRLVMGNPVFCVFCSDPDLPEPTLETLAEAEPLFQHLQSLRAMPKAPSAPLPSGRYRSPVALLGQELLATSDDGFLIYANADDPEAAGLFAEGEQDAVLARILPSLINPGDRCLVLEATHGLWPCRIAQLQADVSVRNQDAETRARVERCFLANKLPHQPAEEKNRAFEFVLNMEGVSAVSMWPARAMIVIVRPHDTPAAVGNLVQEGIARGFQPYCIGQNGITVWQPFEPFSRTLLFIRATAAAAN